MNASPRSATSASRSLVARWSAVARSQVCTANSAHCQSRPASGVGPSWSCQLWIRSAACERNAPTGSSPAGGVGADQSIASPRTILLNFAGAATMWSTRSRTVHWSQGVWSVMTPSWTLLSRSLSWSVARRSIARSLSVLTALRLSSPRTTVTGQGQCRSRSTPLEADRGSGPPGRAKRPGRPMSNTSGDPAARGLRRHAILFAWTLGQVPGSTTHKAAAAGER